VEEVCLTPFCSIIAQFYYILSPPFFLSWTHSLFLAFNLSKGVHPAMLVISAWTSRDLIQRSRQISYLVPDFFLFITDRVWFAPLSRIVFIGALAAFFNGVGSPFSVSKRRWQKRPGVFVVEKKRITNKSSGRGSRCRTVKGCPSAHAKIQNNKRQKRTHAKGDSA